MILIIVTLYQVTRCPIQQNFSHYQQRFEYVKFRTVPILCHILCLHMVLQANTDNDSSVHSGVIRRHPTYSVLGIQRAVHRYILVFL